MTEIRHEDLKWEIHDDEWPRWVRLGWVPPEALVLSARWTKGVWRRADGLEVYHLYRPSSREEAPPPPVDRSVRRHGPFGIFRGPGPSITELLVLVNLIVGIALYLRWGEAYSEHLWAYSTRLKEVLESGGVQVLFIPLFLHADVGHLTGNMLTFVFAGAVIEEFYGRLRMSAIYVGAGLAGALLSLLRVKDVLSVGASGAILGMYGAGLVFLLRERGHFNASQRYRLKRVQIPFFLLLVIPSILHADFYSHLGGFLGGAALAAILRPLPERLPRPAVVPVDLSVPIALDRRPPGQPIEGTPPPAFRPPGVPSSAPVRPQLRLVPLVQEPRLDAPPTADGGTIAGPELERPDEGSAGRGDG